jgi:hypothetical protein
MTLIKYFHIVDHCTPCENPSCESGDHRSGRCSGSTNYDTQVSTVLNFSIDDDDDDELTAIRRPARRVQQNAASDPT